MDDDDDDHRWEEHLDETPPGWDEEEGEMMEMEEESRNYIATPGRLWPGPGSERKTTNSRKEGFLKEKKTLLGKLCVCSTLYAAPMQCGGHPQGRGRRRLLRECGVLPK